MRSYILTGKRNATEKLSCIACGLQTRALTRILSQASVLFYRFCLPGMLTDIHVYVLIAVTIFSFLVI